MITHRPFEQGDDIEAITQFLLDTYALYGHLVNWEPRRWHGQVFHNNDADAAAYRASLPEQVHIWQAAGGDIIGVVIPENAGSVFLLGHPAFRAVDADMLGWAETHLATPDRPLGIWALEGDTHRTTLLGERGYQRTDIHEITRRRSTHAPIPEVPLPAGYRLRCMRHHPDDHAALARLLNAAFNRTFHSAEEYRNFQTSPIYRAELDIVVEAPDGALVANAALTAHERESFAVFEPVCTHPDHQGMGLARAAMAEGLRRMRALGIRTVFVGAWYSNPVSNHVYQKMGFADAIRHYLWCQGET